MPDYNLEAILRVADQRVIGEIIRIGRERGLSDDHILAALATGIVEDNLRHSAAVRDGTSVGWRQETRSSYGSVERRMDLAGSINRFYNELDQIGRGGRSVGMWAAAVQRPASQYRGRYDQALAAARAILQRFAGGIKAGQGPGGPAEPPPDPWDPRAALLEMITAISDFTKQAASGQPGLGATPGLTKPPVPADATVESAQRLVDEAQAQQGGV
jgi:hypothetical protein